jgi:hypothetical protein
LPKAGRKNLKKREKGQKSGSGKNSRERQSRMKGKLKKFKRVLLHP